MTTLQTVDSAALVSQNIGAGLVEVFSKTLAGDDPISAIVAIRISGRGAATTVDIRIKVLVGGILLADNVVEYLATATTSLEIQTIPFIWRNGETLQVYVSSSSAADSSVGVATVVSTEDAPVIDNAAIGVAVVQTAITGSQPAGSLARIVRDIKQADVLFEGQIVTATSDTATLNGAATTVCVGQAISIGEEGDAERQTRFVTGFDPLTGIVTLDQPWCVIPPDGSDYQIKTQRNALVGRVAGYLAGTFGAVLYAISTMIENVSGWRWTAKAMEETPIAVNVLPATGITAERSSGVVLSPFVGETISQSITIYQNDGITPIDLSTKSLEIVFEARSGTDVIVIPDGDITISGDDDNVVTFAYPSAVTVAERLLRFSLRDDAAPRTVYLSGLCRVTIAPGADP